MMEEESQGPDQLQDQHNEEDVGGTILAQEQLTANNAFGASVMARAQHGLGPFQELAISAGENGRGIFQKQGQFMLEPQSRGYTLQGLRNDYPVRCQPPHGRQSSNDLALEDAA